MKRMIKALLFIFLVLKLTRCENEEQTEQTKPDPYFEEWKDNAWQRPNQCHVCRLLVTELYDSFNRTNKKDILQAGYELDDLEKKTITYDKSEIRLLETMENVCDKMKLYVSRSRRKFPYVKGVKSHFREGIDNLIKNSAVNLNIEMPPDDLVDDSTKEIIRLKFKCVHMLENYEDDITEWYFKYREQDLLDWLCKHRVLKSEEQECLDESDELVAPEDNTTTTVHTTDEKSQEETAIEKEEESEYAERHNEAKNEDDSEDDIPNFDDNIDLSESHLEL